jgi:hypothetical protein
VRAVSVTDVREVEEREPWEDVIEDETPLPEGDELDGLEVGTVDDDDVGDKAEDGNDGMPG